jgi:hypothetical protein
MDFVSDAIVKPGTYPIGMLDQRVYWVGTDGRAYDIKTLTADEILWALDYSLANAAKLRTTWSMAKKEGYDVKQRARKWMLTRPAVRALLVQLGKAEDAG